MNPSFTTRVLDESDVQLLCSVLEVFAKVFDDHDSYLSKPPSNEYLGKLLTSETFIAIAALLEDQVIGGLAGYTLHKLEQERSEFYIYDLAVKEDYRRQGVATTLIKKLQGAAAKRGVHVIFVQADYGDDPAVALYTKLGTRENVVHFDILPSHSAA